MTYRPSAFARFVARRNIALWESNRNSQKWPEDKRSWAQRSVRRLRRPAGQQCVC